jgi:hypothetical protein
LNLKLIYLFIHAIVLSILLQAYFDLLSCGT